MILLRRILTVFVAVLMAAGVSLHANAAASMADMTKAPIAAATVGECMCDACDDEGMDAGACCAICAAPIGLLPDDTVWGAQRGPSVPVSAAAPARGRVSPPATAPPNILLG